jgi:predicted secreted protein
MSKLSKQLSRPWVKAMVASTAMACATGAWAQNAATAPAQPANVVQLSAEGSVDVVQDLLTATLSATREGRDAATVQSQLQKVVEAAMAVTKHRQLRHLSALWQGQQGRGLAGPGRDPAAGP